jgi:hypothetical protein
LDDLQRGRIRNFLKEFKEIASKGRGIDVIPRRENIDNLAELCLTRKNRNDEIMTLSVADYCKGPEPDKDKPGEIWVFGKQIDNKEVYIKLKIAQVREEKVAKCLSFHIVGYSLCYPYKEKTIKKRGDDK